MVEFYVNHNDPKNDKVALSYFLMKPTVLDTRPLSKFGCELEKDFICDSVAFLVRNCSDFRQNARKNRKIRLNSW